MAYFVLFGALLLAVAFRALLCLVVAHNQLFYRNLLKDSLQTEGELGLPAKKNPQDQKDIGNILYNYIDCYLPLRFQNFLLLPQVFSLFLLSFESLQPNRSLVEYLRLLVEIWVVLNLAKALPFSIGLIEIDIIVANQIPFLRINFLIIFCAFIVISTIDCVRGRSFPLSSESSLGRLRDKYSLPDYSPAVLSDEFEGA